MVQEFDSVQIRTGGKYEKHMYYRRPRNGEEQASWIVVAGTNAGRIQDMTSRGFEPLFQYGTIEDWEKRTGQYINDLGPMGIWRPLLERGGAKEFPAEQVIIARWYKESPQPGRDPQDLFPQLKGHTLKEYQCPACRVAPFLAQRGGWRQGPGSASQKGRSGTGPAQDLRGRAVGGPSNP